MEEIKSVFYSFIPNIKIFRKRMISFSGKGDNICLEITSNKKIVELALLKSNQEETL